MVTTGLDDDNRLAFYAKKQDDKVEIMQLRINNETKHFETKEIYSLRGVDLAAIEADTKVISEAKFQTLLYVLDSAGKLQVIVSDDSGEFKPIKQFDFTDRLDLMQCVTNLVHSRNLGFCYSPRSISIDGTTFNLYSKNKREMTCLDSKTSKWWNCVNVMTIPGSSLQLAILKSGTALKRF